MKFKILFITLLLLAPFPVAIASDELTLKIDIDIPKIDVSPYFRPYVAIWLETPDRKPVTTLAVWYMLEMPASSQEDGKKWLKDMRQWWRKIGRNQSPPYDAVTGATRKPGTHALRFSVTDFPEIELEKKYVLHFEAAREEGGRSYQKVPLEFSDNQKKTHIPETSEIGSITVSVEK